MGRLLLVDGNSIINRAYYAVIGRAPMTAPDGTPTGAVNGFFNSVLGVMKEYEPDHLCILFDRREPTFRHKMSAEYKANRHGMPDDLAAQMPVVKELCDLLGMPRMELAGFEADDLIGTLSKQGEDAGMDVFIFSGDHDDFQLISDKVSVVMPQSGKGKEPRVLFDRERFETTYGVKPELFVHVKALMGDNSDNIKGVDKVGEKTAFKLIAQYETTDGVYEHAGELSPALKTKISESKELLDMNLKLCTIVRDAPVPYGVDKTGYTGQISDSQALADRLSQLALKQLTKKLDLESVKPTVASTTEDPFVSELQAKLEKLIADGPVIKQEIPSAVPEGANAEELNVGIGFVSVNSRSYVLLLDLAASVFYQMSVQDACALFDKDEDVFLAAYGYKDASKVCPRALRSVKAVFDTMIAGYVCNKIEGKADFERLYVSVTSLAYPIEEQQEAKQLSLFDEPSEDEGKTVVTAALKLYANMVIAKVLKRDIDKDEQIKKLLYDIEFPLVITLDSIERCGMNVSWERLNRLHEEYSRRLEDTCARIYDLSGFEFNINSPKQLADVLFAEDKLALPHGKKNKTGVYSTDIDELNRLKYMHPVIKYIIEYRELSKLDSTYAVGLVKAIADDGRIHTRFTQAMTNTGRLSSAEPNLQNIPVRSVEGSRLREAFTAPEGRVLVDADYSQIELRLLAALSEDPIMCDAFMKGEDIHRRTAAKVFGVDESEVTPKMRAQAKTVNFSIIYGISDYGLSNDLDIGIKDAGNLIKEYGNQFPGIMNYLDRLKEEGISKGYAETYYGRRRNLTELKSQNRNLRNFGLRAAMNTPIQGTAADVIKIAMNRAYRALREELPDSLLVMQVHDELIVECDEKDAAKASEILKREMEAAAEFKVPLVADVHTGKDWLRAK